MLQCRVASFYVEIGNRIAIASRTWQNSSATTSSYTADELRSELTHGSSYFRSQWQVNYSFYFIIDLHYALNNQSNQITHYQASTFSFNFQQLQFSICESSNFTFNKNQISSFHEKYLFILFFDEKAPLYIS
jgi:hypothetical protein